jgi:hypothetical protein
MTVAADNPTKARGSCRDDISIQTYIESRNIANFQRLLDIETDAVKCKILRQLLADEMAKYAAHVEAKIQR